jgi:hypothetical protein
MMVETSRLLTYETAIAVDMADGIAEAKESGELDGMPGGEELASQARWWTTLARALTPIAKYYATEMCNEVVYDALQVLAGSGYMRDYEMERLYRDARITTIYEGTTQIQQAAALGGVLKGTLEERYAQLHEELSGEDEAVLSKLEEARGLLSEAVAHANEQDAEFRDLHAGKLVESATIIFNAYLLLRAASHSPHKHALAEHYMNEELPKVRMRRDQVMSGSRTYLDRMPELLNYE